MVARVDETLTADRQNDLCLVQQQKSADVPDIICL